MSDTPEQRPVWRLYINGEPVLTTTNENSAWDCMNVAIHTDKPCHLTKDGLTVDSFVPWHMRIAEIHP